METINIPKQEYFDLLNLYKEISEKIKTIESYNLKSIMKKTFDAHKYCGLITFTEDPQKIQQQLRDEW